MALTNHERVRYARHLLLAEIGEAGQDRLVRSTVFVSRDTDEGARAQLSDLLARAGVTVSEAPTADDVGLGTSDDLVALADTPELLEAARTVRASFAAVEVIKSLVGAGQGAPFPSQLKLSSEDV